MEATPTVGPRRTVLRLTFAGRMVVPFVGAGFLAGWLLGGTTGLFGATTLAVFLLAPFLGWLSVRRLELALPRPARNPVGEPFLMELLVANRSRAFTARDVVLCHGEDPSDDPRPAAAVHELRRGRSARVALAQRLIERGRKKEVALVAFSTFPFGLFRCGLAFQVPADLLGLPRIGSLTHLERLPAERPELQLDRSFARQGEEEFYGVRDWRPGESLRRVHWRLSARRDVLVAREFRPVARPPVRLILVTSVAGLGQWLRRDPSFEKAVSMTATLGEHYLRLGRAVQLVYTDGGAPSGLRRSRLGFESLLVSLAEVQPRSGDAWRALEKELGGRGRPGTAIAVLAGGGARRRLDTLAPGRAVVFDVDDHENDEVFRRGGKRRGAPAFVTT